MDRLDALQPQQQRALRHELTQALNPGPDAHFAGEVLARLESGGSAATKRRAWTRGLQWAAACMALLICLQWGAPQRSVPNIEMTARGGAATATALLGTEVYRHRAGAPQPVRLHNGDMLANGDGMTFTLLNRGPEASAARILLIDATQEITWLQPAEESADTSLSLPAKHTLNLKEGITLTDLPRGPQRIVTLFWCRASVTRCRAGADALWRGGGSGAPAGNHRRADFAAHDSVRNEQSLSAAE